MTIKNHQNIRDDYDFGRKIRVKKLSTLWKKLEKIRDTSLLKIYASFIDYNEYSDDGE